MSGPRVRLSLRWRLALLYAGLIALIAAVLLLLSALLVGRAVTATAGFAPGTLVRVRSADGVETVVRSEDLLAALRSQAVSSVLRVGGLAFALVVLAAAALGYIVAARALRPVAQITATARRLSTETLSERMDLAGPRDELWELAATFDAMLARLAAAFDAQRRFVANASHELRTPLAVMRTEVDVALADPGAQVRDLREMGERVRAATERADRLVDSLLLLARAQAGAQAPAPPWESGEDVDLAATVPAALTAVAAEIDTAGLRVDCDLRAAPLVGDPRLLERMVGNLVENAVRHNQVGGWVRIHTARLPDAVTFTIGNGGPPVDAAGLFDPFRRGGAARASGRGAGLGLSIVEAVVLAHAGSVVATPRDPGGLEVEIRLPTSGHLSGSRGTVSAP